MKKMMLMLMALTCFNLKAEEVQPIENPLEKHLEKRILNGDKRRDSFLLVLQMITERNAKVLVETGTSRNGDLNFWGDGGSTIIFGEWATENDAMLYTVDIADWAMFNSKKATQPYAEHINYTLGDSITFLKNFTQPIDFLYLDSYDFDVNNPLPSQEHHLKEIIAAFPFLHERSIVMIDDCDLPFGGKGIFVVAFLISQGWKIVYEGYQTILVNQTSD